MWEDWDSESNGGHGGGKNLIVRQVEVERSAVNVDLGVDIGVGVGMVCGFSLRRWVVNGKLRHHTVG